MDDKPRTPIRKRIFEVVEVTQDEINWVTSIIDEEKAVEKPSKWVAMMESNQGSLMVASGDIWIPPHFVWHATPNLPPHYIIGRVTEYAPDPLAEVNPYKPVLDLVIDLLILVGISWVLTDLAHLGGHSDLMFVRRIKNWK